MSTYEFPTRPVPAVGAIVFRGSQVLLVRRRDPPSQGWWSIPGGAVEVGETVEQAVVRETREETTVEVRPREVVAVADFIEKEGAGVRRQEDSSGALGPRGSRGALAACGRIVPTRPRTVGRAPGLPGGR